MPMTDQPFRVLPVVDDENRFFWTSGEDGRLRFLRCQDCGYYLHPPSPRCPACGSRTLAPEPVSGEAIVYSYTVNQGLRLTTNLVGCPPDDVHIGMPVQITFDRRDDIWFPVVEPAVAVDAEVVA
jgi:uncharacterized OB-fold protein